MTAAPSLPAEKPKRAPTLYAIVGFKLLKGIGALLLALGVYQLRDNNLPDEFDRLVEFLHVDPDNRFVSLLADRVAEITPTNLHWVVILSVLYSFFVMLQGFGLMFRVKWIVWLVIGESAFFLPIEILELMRKPSWVKAAIIAVNVLIVWYLFANRQRLIRSHEPDEPVNIPAANHLSPAPSATPSPTKAN